MTAREQRIADLLGGLRLSRLRLDVLIDDGETEEANRHRRGMNLQLAEALAHWDVNGSTDPHQDLLAIRTLASAVLGPEDRPWPPP